MKHNDFFDYIAKASVVRINPAMGTLEIQGGPPGKETIVNDRFIPGNMESLCQTLQRTSAGLPVVYYAPDGLLKPDSPEYKVALHLAAAVFPAATINPVTVGKDRVRLEIQTIVDGVTHTTITNWNPFDCRPEWSSGWRDCMQWMKSHGWSYGVGPTTCYVTNDRKQTSHMPTRNTVVGIDHSVLYAMAALLGH